MPERIRPVPRSTFCGVSDCARTELSDLGRISPPIRERHQTLGEESDIETQVACELVLAFFFGYNEVVSRATCSLSVPRPTGFADCDGRC
jgi:hypothetical protein